MTSKPLSASQRRALEILKYNMIEAPAQFARLMWPDSPAWKNHTKKGRGTTRGGGMAVAAGCYLGKLRRAGYVSNIGFILTTEGEKALENENSRNG